MWVCDLQIALISHHVGHCVSVDVGVVVGVECVCDSVVVDIRSIAVTVEQLMMM